VELKQRIFFEEHTSRMEFESNQSGIETKRVIIFLLCVVVFESNQSGIETIITPAEMKALFLSLNRTRVELKPLVSLASRVTQTSLNRTRVELKHDVGIPLSHKPPPSLNRTRVELKLSLIIEKR